MLKNFQFRPFVLEENDKGIEWRKEKERAGERWCVDSEKAQALG